MHEFQPPELGQVFVHYVAPAYVFADVFGLGPAGPFNIANVQGTSWRRLIGDGHLATERAAEAVDELHTLCRRTGLNSAII